MKLDSELMLDEFLKRLESKTAEQLLADIEKARENSKDSWKLEGGDAMQTIVNDYNDIHSVPQ